MTWSSVRLLQRLVFAVALAAAAPLLAQAPAPASAPAPGRETSAASVRSYLTTQLMPVDPEVATGTLQR